MPNCFFSRLQVFLLLNFLTAGCGVDERAGQAPSDDMTSVGGGGLEVPVAPENKKEAPSPDLPEWSQPCLAFREKGAKPLYVPNPDDPSSPPVKSCGDGVLDENEACDDGNWDVGDGCAACLVVEPGYICPCGGGPCFPIAVCGNGAREIPEQCDDGGYLAGDGCDEKCRIEPQFKCVENQECVQTTCGDDLVEGSESCESGFAGSCSEQCQIIPNCFANGECATQCGDGLLASSEQCDDGNVAGLDGCSSQCETEPGYTCTNDGGISLCQGTCGDGLLAIGEQCDTGINEGGYNRCEPGCVLSSFCGDGILDSVEDCDPLDPNSSPKCKGCRILIVR